MREDEAKKFQIVYQAEIVGNRANLLTGVVGEACTNAG
jgi:hypothetical protein